MILEVMAVKQATLKTASVAVTGVGFCQGASKGALSLASLQSRLKIWLGFSSFITDLAVVSACQPGFHLELQSGKHTVLCPAHGAWGL